MSIQLLGENAAEELKRSAYALQVELIERAQKLVNEACLIYPDDLLLTGELKALALCSDKAHANVVAWDQESGRSVYLRVFYIPECAFDDVVNGLK